MSISGSLAGVAPGQYDVKVVNPDGSSFIASGALKLFVDLAAPVLAEGSRTDTSLEVIWNTVPFADRYLVSISGPGAASSTYEYSTTVSFANLSPLNSYLITVQALNQANGYLSPIAQISLSTRSASFTNPSVVAVAPPLFYTAGTLLEKTQSLNGQTVLVTTFPSVDWGLRIFDNTSGAVLAASDTTNSNGLDACLSDDSVYVLNADTSVLQRFTRAGAGYAALDVADARYDFPMTLMSRGHLLFDRVNNRLLAFVNSSFGWEIYTFNPDLTGATNYSTSVATFLDWTLTRDGTSLFVADGASNLDLHVYETAGFSEIALKSFTSESFDFLIPIDEGFACIGSSGDFSRRRVYQGSTGTLQYDLADDLEDGVQDEAGTIWARNSTDGSIEKRSQYGQLVLRKIIEDQRLPSGGRRFAYDHVTNLVVFVVEDISNGDVLLLTFPGD